MDEQPVPGWHVVNPGIETSGELRPGVFGPGRLVTFQTEAGHTGSVFVPEAEYTTEAVRKKIHEAVAKLSGIANLSHP